MDEKAKKVLLIVIAVAAVGAAAFLGTKALKEPTLTPAYTIGGGKPGHGMKAAEREEMAASKAGKQGGGDSGGADPLAGG